MILVTKPCTHYWSRLCLGVVLGDYKHPLGKVFPGYNLQLVSTTLRNRIWFRRLTHISYASCWPLRWQKTNSYTESKENPANMKSHKRKGQLLIKILYTQFTFVIMMSSLYMLLYSYSYSWELLRTINFVNFTDFIAALKIHSSKYYLQSCTTQLNNVNSVSLAITSLTTPMKLSRSQYNTSLLSSDAISDQITTLAVCKRN